MVSTIRSLFVLVATCGFVIRTSAFLVLVNRPCSSTCWWHSARNPIGPLVSSSLATASLVHDDSNNRTNPPPPSATATTEPSERQGYRFGDLTRSLIGNTVSSFTGKKDSYEFGDVSRRLGSLVSETFSNLTEQQYGNFSYQVGDLTRWIASELLPSSNSNATSKPYRFGDISKGIIAGWTGKDSYQFGDISRAAVANYTGKQTYEFGDLSRSVLRRVESGEYTIEDVFLALRILLWAGLQAFTPVVASLPVSWLVNLINFGLAQEVSGRLTTALAEFLDQRMKQALTGRANYVIGDITKERLEEQLTKFTGKDTYEVGDITQTIQRMQSAAVNKSNKDSKLAFSSDLLSALDGPIKKITAQK